MKIYYSIVKVSTNDIICYDINYTNILYVLITLQNNLGNDYKLLIGVIKNEYFKQI